MKTVESGGAPVVFLGDGLVEEFENRQGRVAWEKYFKTGRYRSLNLGFNSDRTEHVLGRLDNGELSGFEARAVVLEIGTNNPDREGGEPPIDTILGIREILRVIRRKQPQATVWLLRHLPRAVGTADGAIAKDAANARNVETDKIVHSFADGKSVIWVDLYDRFLQDGRIPKELMGDYIHPTEKGYALWRAAMEPLFRRAVGK